MGLSGSLGLGIKGVYQPCQAVITLNFLVLEINPPETLAMLSKHSSTELNTPALVYCFLLFNFTLQL